MVSLYAVTKKRSLTFWASWTSKPSSGYWSSVTWTDTWKISWYLTNYLVGGVDGRSDIQHVMAGKTVRRRQRYGRRKMPDCICMAQPRLPVGSPIWFYRFNGEGIRSAGKRLIVDDEPSELGGIVEFGSHTDQKTCSLPSWRGPT